MKKAILLFVLICNANSYYDDNVHYTLDTNQDLNSSSCPDRLEEIINRGWLDGEKMLMNSFVDLDKTLATGSMTPYYQNLNYGTEYIDIPMSDSEYKVEKIHSHNGSSGVGWYKTYCPSGLFNSCEDDNKKLDFEAYKLNNQLITKKINYDETLSKPISTDHCIYNTVYNQVSDDDEGEQLEIEINVSVDDQARDLETEVEENFPSDEETEVEGPIVEVIEV